MFNPKKKRTKKHPWITKGILKSIKRKNILFRRYLKNPTEHTKSIYKMYRNKLNHVLRYSKRLYFYDKFKQSRNNVNSTWSTINEILNKNGKDSSYPATFKNDDCEISNDNDIASNFNKYFVNLGYNLASKINIKLKAEHFLHNNDKVCHSIFTYPVTVEEVLKVAHTNVKPNKAAGYDDFKPGIIKQVIPYIVKPLTHLCNISFNTGIFPDKLKIAKVKPIFKKGDPSHFENYRPISLLSVFSKIIERLMFNRIYSFLCKYNVLNNEQYGFRPDHSTELALADAVNNIYNSLDKNNTCVGVFLDLSKAFDTIDHKILLSKLFFYGIRGTTLNWLDSYLSNRYQYTLYKNSKSELAKIACGVPQGSILGPLLFIIYVNDIVNVSDIAKTILFADDTNIFFDSQNLLSSHKTVSTELTKFSSWFAANKLSLNIEKTNYMVFNASHSFRWDHNITMNDKIINRVNTTKFLGVHIDNKLSWRDHISAVCNRVARNTGIICKLKHYLPPNILRTLYITLILPQLTYCTTIWSGTYSTNLNHLCVLQKRAIRHISHAAPRDHTSPLYKRLNLLKLNDIIRVQLATFAYKAWNGLLPEAFKDFIYSNRLIHNHQTRHCNNAHVLSQRSTLSSFNPRIRAIKTWNNLQDNVKNKPSYSVFKRNLQTVIISHY